MYDETFKKKMFVCGSYALLLISPISKKRDREREIKLSNNVYCSLPKPNTSEYVYLLPLLCDCGTATTNGRTDRQTDRHVDKLDRRTDT